MKAHFLVVSWYIISILQLLGPTKHVSVHQYSTSVHVCVCMHAGGCAYSININKPLTCYMHACILYLIGILPLTWELSGHSHRPLMYLLVVPELVNCLIIVTSERRKRYSKHCSICMKCFNSVVFMITSPQLWAFRKLLLFTVHVYSQPLHHSNFFHISLLASH